MPPIDMRFARHDWNDDLREEREWLTSITTSRGLKEQRQGLRSKPRVTITPTFNMWDEDHKQFNDVLLQGTGALVTHCDWSQMCTLMSFTLTGDAVVDYVPSSYQPGMVAIFYGGPGYVASVAITTVAGLVLGLGATPPWVQGRRCLICPLVTSFMGANVETSYPTAGKLGASFPLMRYVSNDLFVDPIVPPVPDAVQARTGLEILLRHPDRSVDVTHEFFRQGNMMDASYGSFIYYPATAFPTITLNMDFKEMSPAKVDWMRGFHDRMAGARKPFILPAWTEAFTLLGAGTAPATQVKIKGSSFQGNTWLTTVQTFLFVVWSNLDMSAHQITGISADGADTQIQCALDPFPSPTDKANIKFICLAFKARQASDTMVLTHQTTALARVAFSAVAVRV